jgi:hypothetical protein
MSVVETTTFRLAPGVSRQDFMALDRRLQTELVYHQPGFARRTTAQRGTEWVVVTLWASEADAANAEHAVGGEPLQAEFDALLEPGSMDRRRYDTLD